ncbi:hypothetical protein KUCAC02_015358, partial [Chaenocephalus aceratus]
ARRARLRTDAVYLHVGAQGYGLVRGHDAEQRSGGGPEGHGLAAAGDRAAAEGDHHEPEGDNQGTNVQVEPLREPEPPGRGTRREAARGEEHDGGCIPGHHGHPGPAGADFTDAQTETGESRAVQPREQHRAGEQPQRPAPDKIDDMEKQVLSGSTHIGRPNRPSGMRPTSGNRVESTLTTLHHRITDLEKGKETRPTDKFQLTFPLRTNYMYAKPRGASLRFQRLPGVGTPFSYAVPGQTNELVLIEWGTTPWRSSSMTRLQSCRSSSTTGMASPVHHVDPRDGMWEAFQDGVMRGSGENLAPYHPIKPEGVLVLGQEQDTLGGGFDATQAYQSTGRQRVLLAESNIEIFGGATKWTFEPCRSLN